MFANCFPNTLDTTVHYREDETGKPDTYVYTGDIPAMWLRDSGAQVWPYVQLCSSDPQLQRMIAGVIRRQFKLINIDPYANAFNVGPTGVHNKTDFPEADPMVFERRALNEKRGLIPQIEPRYRYPYFSHIFDGGYSAGYYFYTWAEVLDKDAFAAFRESGDLFNKKIAADFRAKLLARGGSEDGMSLYRAFRGADPDKRAMLRSRGLWDEPEPEPADEGEALLQPEIRQE